MAGHIHRYVAANRTETGYVDSEIFLVHIRFDEDEMCKLGMIQLRSLILIANHFDFAQCKRQNTTTHAVPDQDDRTCGLMRAQNSQHLSRPILTHENTVFVSRIAEEFFMRRPA